MGILIKITLIKKYRSIQINIRIIIIITIIIIMIYLKTRMLAITIAMENIKINLIIPI